jgi:magnesium transporter
MFNTHFLLSVRDCLFDGEGSFSTREVDLLFGDGWLLSLRKPGDKGEPAMPVKDVVERFERTRRLDGATDEGFLLFVFLDTIVDRFFDVSDAVEERLEAIEDEIFADPARVRSSGPADRTITERLYRLRHDLIGFRRVVSPLRDAVNPLLRNEVEFLGDAAVLHLRDVYDHVLRAVEMSEAHRDLLTGALDAHLSLVSNRMNLVMKRATSWAAILVVPTLVAGIYGMNFQHMPELGWQEGYPLAIGTMVLISAVLYVTFKRRDWL